MQFNWTMQMQSVNNYFKTNYFVYPNNFKYTTVFPQFEFVFANFTRKTKTKF